MLDMMKLLKDPIAFFLSEKKKKGENFTLSMPGNASMTVTSSPESARALFTLKPDQTIPSPGHPVGPLLGERSLILLSGDEHSAQRKRLFPQMKGTELIPLIENITNESLERAGKKIHLQDFFQNITLEIILKGVFGIDENQIKNVIPLIEKFTGAYSPLFVALPWSRKIFGVSSFWKRFNASRDELDRSLLSLIPEENFLKQMQRELELSPEAFSDLLRTIIVAGHETSATTLVWALSLILNDAEYVRKLEEGWTPEDEEIEAILLESMRLFPPVPFVTRQITKDIEWDTYKFGAGSNMALSVILLHRNEAVFENSERFEPGRFMGKKYTPFEFAPFGGGHRKCLGVQLAMVEMKVVLKTLLTRERFKLLNTSLPKPEILNITMGPKKPIYVQTQG